MKLRIIAGTLGGRLFEAPEGRITHPMGERVRGALFNMLGDISGQRVLDPFAGSGALSFEAISRGASSALAIERDRRAQHIIAANIATLNLNGRVALIKASASAWSEHNKHELFDLILADPPYHDMQLSTVVKLLAHLKSDGLMVLSHSGREPAPTLNGAVVVNERHYGDAALAFYHKAAPQGSPV